jgi:streptogramin lyase
MTSTVRPVAITRSIADLRVDAKIALGRAADWVAITDDAVWIGSTGPNAVNRIDPISNEITSRVELPGIPCAGLALGFGHLWVPLGGKDPSLAQVDLLTTSLREVFPVPFVAPEGGVTTGGGSVWLSVDDEGTVARIDPENGLIQQTVQLPAGSYNPLFSEGLIWVTHANGASVATIDPASGSQHGTTWTGPAPRFLAAGHRAIWTLNQGDGSLTRIDARSQTVLSTVALNTPGTGGDIAVGAGRIWTTVRGTPLSATDMRTGRLLCQWVGSGGDSIGVGHGAIWLVNCRAGEVSKIDLNIALSQAAA